jgi:hypothetical protein
MPPSPPPSPPPRPSYGTTDLPETVYRDPVSRPEASARPYQETFNPYAAPSTPMSEGQLDEIADGPLAHQRITVGEILGQTFKMFQHRFWDVLKFGFVLVGLYIIFALLTYPIGFFIQFVANEPEIVLPLSLVNSIWSQVISSVMMLIAFRYALNLTEGRANPSENVLTIQPYILRFIGAQILMFLIFMAIVVAFAMVIGAGVALFMIVNQGNNQPAAGLALAAAIIAGVLVYFVFIVRFSFTQLFILDQNADVFSSISNSFRYTKGNSVTLILALLVTMLFGMIFVLFTLLFGLILFMPFCMLELAVAYRLITGRPVATGEPRAVAGTVV